MSAKPKPSRPVQPQKSEVHEATADASTSPTAPGDERTTPRMPSTAPQQQGSKPRVPEPPVGGTRIVDDETDDGGPLIIQSGDPKLVHIEPPVDPFPTDGTPEIDPEVGE